MRHLFLILLPCLLVSCSGSETAPREDGLPPEAFWLAPPMLVSYGLLAGLAAGWAIARYLKPRRAREKTSVVRPQAVTNAASPDLALEEKYYALVESEKQLREANREQQRSFAEYRQLYGPKDKLQAKAGPQTGDPAAAPSGEILERREPVRLYFLQPSEEGRFMEVNKVAEAGNALYELSYEEGANTEANLCFIGTPRYTSFAIQNESTWILAACERSNLPGPQTQCVRTDAPGKAVYQDGAWQITQKIKITYT